MTEAQRVDTGFAKVSGAPLYYEMAGAGHPLVLIHEGIADSRMYDDQFGAFAQHYRVIRYDVHGFGKSGIPTGPFSSHEALYDLLRVLGVERTYFLGMSMGGGIALNFTLTYPTMVDALILAAAGVGGYTGSDVVKQQWSEIGAALDRGDMAEAVELALRMWVDGPQRALNQVDPAVRERVREMIAHAFALPESDPQPLEPPALSRLAEIHVPTLIIVGSGDVPDILAQADLLEQGIAGAQKVVIPGVAHVPNMERPRDFNRIVLNFLGTLKGSWR
jgi:pimeloyl-ACP methyl ester carboxylesterase